ncbi:MAG TPA: hypothetical protein VNK04_13860 [Gemmataceae bacterium]|nr:hypothetical protein [Gemmataceae bacterium]
MSEDPRATFRSAGFWMGLVGWVELLAGSALGVAWLLAITGVAPRAAGSTPSDWVFTPLQAVAGIGIGVLTLIAGRAFRRAAEVADGCPPAVAGAVASLRELYERQLWVIALVVGIALGGLLLWR